MFFEWQLWFSKLLPIDPFTINASFSPAKLHFTAAVIVRSKVRLAIPVQGLCSRTTSGNLLTLLLFRTLHSYTRLENAQKELRRTPWRSPVRQELSQGTVELLYQHDGVCNQRKEIEQQVRKCFHMGQKEKEFSQGAIELSSI